MIIHHSHTHTHILVLGKHTVVVVRNTIVNIQWAVVVAVVVVVVVVVIGGKPKLKPTLILLLVMVGYDIGHELELRGTFLVPLSHTHTSVVV